MNVDPARVYLTGLSMGGHGTWEIAARHLARFAAISRCAVGASRGASRWRRTRERRTAMPAELWAAATGGREPTACIGRRALGVDDMSLARQIAEGGGIGRTDGAPSGDFDFRRGIDSLARIWRANLASDPCSGAVFVFRSKMSSTTFPRSAAFCSRHSARSISTTPSPV